MAAANARAVQSVSCTRRTSDSRVWNSSGWARNTGNMAASVWFPAMDAAEPVYTASSLLNPTAASCQNRRKTASARMASSGSPGTPAGGRRARPGRCPPSSAGDRRDRRGVGSRGRRCRITGVGRQARPPAAAPSRSRRAFTPFPSVGDLATPAWPRCRFPRAPSPDSLARLPAGCAVPRADQLRDLVGPAEACPRRGRGRGRWPGSRRGSPARPARSWW